MSSGRNLSAHVDGSSRDHSRVLKWECEAKERASADAIGGGDMPAVRLDDRVAKCQAQPCAVRAMGRKVIERFKDTLLATWWQPGSPVRNADGYALGRSTCRNLDQRGGRCELGSILQQVHQHLL